MSSPSGDSGITSPNSDIFHDANDSRSYSISSDPDDLSKMGPEARSRAEEEWRSELVKVEEEIATLRSVLASKTARMQELKRKLGITVWKEFREDMEQGIKNIKESTAYQKTSQTLKNAGEHASEALSTIQASVSKKWEEAKKSQTYKNLGEKVDNAKAKVSGENTDNNLLSSENPADK